MTPTDEPYFRIRRSRTHGSGAFALRPIPAGTRLIEYTGERISHEEADARPDVPDGTGSLHILLFTVDARTVIDARVGGNEAQYFNHSCDGNCEAVIDKRRVFLETRRDVAAGEELTYDYEMEYSGEDLETARREYPCRCGSPACRGTLLDVPARLIEAEALKPQAPRRKTAAGNRRETTARAPRARSAPGRGSRRGPATRGVRTASRTGERRRG
jgi:hypothetical protein